MHWIYTCVIRNAQNLYPFCLNHTPSAHLMTTQEDIFPGQLQLQKLNQFKSVLASSYKFMKNLNFLTFSTNFTHFYFEFLNESLDPKDHFGTNGSRIHPVLMKKNITPSKWSYQFDFLCIVIYVIN